MALQWLRWWAEAHPTSLAEVFVSVIISPLQAQHRPALRCTIRLMAHLALTPALAAAAMAPQWLRWWAEAHHTSLAEALVSVIINPLQAQHRPALRCTMRLMAHLASTPALAAAAYGTAVAALVG